LNELESARKILEILKENTKIVILRDLAKQAGFPSASSVDFKKGFNFLQRREIVKLRQSGWRSEKRGGRSHPKSVILVADIYEVERVEQEIAEEKGEWDDAFARTDEIELVPVLTLSGDPTFVSTEEYKRVVRSKEKLFSFWIPKDRRTRLRGQSLLL